MAGFKTVDEAVRHFLGELTKFDELRAKEDDGNEVIASLERHGYYFVDGDAILYKRSGILFVGQPDLATDVAQKFSRDGGVPFSENLTWIHAPDGTQKPKVYNHKSRKPVSAPLEWIIYLTSPLIDPTTKSGISWRGAKGKALIAMLYGYSRATASNVGGILGMTDVKIACYGISEADNIQGAHANLKGLIDNYPKPT